MDQRNEAVTGSTRTRPSCQLQACATSGSMCWTYLQLPSRCSCCLQCLLQVLALLWAMRRGAKQIFNLVVGFCTWRYYRTARQNLERSLVRPTAALHSCCLQRCIRKVLWGGLSWGLCSGNLSLNLHIGNAFCDELFPLPRGSPAQEIPDSCCKPLVFVIRALEPNDVVRRGSQQYLSCCSHQTMRNLCKESPRDPRHAALLAPARRTGCHSLPACCASESTTLADTGTLPTAFSTLPGGQLRCHRQLLRVYVLVQGLPAQLQHIPCT